MNGNPVMDFCALISAKEDTPGGSGALSILDEKEQGTLDGLLTRYARARYSWELDAMEREGRQFLTRYRELERYTGVLDEQERSRLNGILDGTPAPAPLRKKSPSGFPVTGKTVIASAAVLATLAAGLVVGNFLRSQFESQQTGTSSQVQQHQGGAQVPLAPTDLQRTEALLGPWRTITPSDQRPQTANPAILLLNGGGTEASAKWQIPAASQGWITDQSGAIGQVVMHGTYADITDADGTPYVVGTGQAFVFASSPSAVFRINPDGTPQSLTLAQAVAARQSPGTK